MKKIKILLALVILSGHHILFADPPSLPGVPPAGAGPIGGGGAGAPLDGSTITILILLVAVFIYYIFIIYKKKIKETTS